MGPTDDATKLSLCCNVGGKEKPQLNLNILDIWASIWWSVKGTHSADRLHLPEHGVISPKDRYRPFVVLCWVMMIDFLMMTLMLC